MSLMRTRPQPNEVVFEGDCIEVVPQVVAEPVDLVYLDPPFFTQKIHKLKTRDRSREFSFRDVWASQNEYAAFLHARISVMREALAPTGSIFFHCDRRSAHIARGILDDVFGVSNFRAEIVWCYRRWSNAQRSLLPCHQVIFFYSKTKEYKFNTIYTEYSPSTNVDQILQRRKRDSHGKSVYAIGKDGRPESNGEKRGVPLSDVWDIPYLNPKAKERVGYPTQKPIALLERIIEISTDAEDLVLDPFCGSGSMLVAAALSGRRAIGVDVSPEAVQLARKRLVAPAKSRSTLLEEGRESFRNADSSVLRHLAGLDVVPVQRNKGIDALLAKPFDDRPVPIRVQRPGESFGTALAALERAARTKHAHRMILVLTSDSREPSADALLDRGVVVVRSAALQVAVAMGGSDVPPGQTALFEG